jgi:hypothetical protein
VLDQLVYKWSHSRGILARCLAERYDALEASGWPVTDTEIQLDVSEMLGGAFERFCAG